MGRPVAGSLPLLLPYLEPGTWYAVGNANIRAVSRRDLSRRLVISRTNS